MHPNPAVSVLGIVIVTSLELEHTITFPLSLSLSVRAVPYSATVAKKAGLKLAMSADCTGASPIKLETVTCRVSGEPPGSFTIASTSSFDGDPSDGNCVIFLLAMFIQILVYR